MSQTEAHQVAVLTLTYGDRIDMLSQMIDAVAKEGVQHIFAVANGLRPAPLAQLHKLREQCAARNLRLEILENPENLGSARGFKRLLQAVRNDAAVHAVWFMDDDNIPQPSALQCLLSAHYRHPQAALASVRQDRSYLIKIAETGEVEPPPVGQVFHVDISRRPKRILRRLGLLAQRAPAPDPVPEDVAVYRVPYGGLFVPRARIEDLAPPREDFILYADDYEYSERLAASHGLYLVGAARIEDLEASWNATGAAPQAQRSQFERLATMPADFRLYYSVRNAVYLDRKRIAGTGFANSVLLWANVTTFLLQGCVRCILHGNTANAWALWRATTDGLSGRLGLKPDFPLP